METKTHNNIINSNDVRFVRVSVSLSVIFVVADDKLSGKSVIAYGIPSHNSSDEMCNLVTPLIWTNESFVRNDYN